MTDTKREKVFIPVLLGTARKGRQSATVAEFIFRQLEVCPGVRTELLDIEQFFIHGTSDALNDAKSRAWAQVMNRADGLLVVSPEYNHGYPGELKIVLDELSDEYVRKPVAVCGVSSGGMGGVRVVEQLRQVFVELGMVPVSSAVYFSFVQDLFDAEGDLKKKDFYEGRVKKVFDELLWYARVLKAARSSFL